jgi:Cu+-exporting ATPase
MRFRLSPLDKLSAVRDLQRRGNRVLMVGDGLNDAGALAAADVGIAVSDNTACLVPTCDAVLAGTRLAELDHIVDYARRARWVISLCFAVSLVYNAVGLGLALTGRLTPLATAILMPVSSLTIVALSVGLMRRLPLPEVTR